MKQRLTIGEILRGFWSLITGMAITLRQMVKPTVTVAYPHEALKMAPRFRGHIELLKDKETGQTLCTACKMCEKACPSSCITVEGIKPEGATQRVATKYLLDFTRCSLCGACVEACSTDGIRFSKDYNLASTRREDYVMDLYQSMKEKDS